MLSICTVNIFRRSVIRHLCSSPHFWSSPPCGEWGSIKVGQTVETRDSDFIPTAFINSILFSLLLHVSLYLHLT